MVYREPVGELPALHRAVSQLHAALRRRRQLVEMPPEGRPTDYEAQLERCEAEVTALQGAQERFDDAFAEAAESIVAGGGPKAKRLEQLLVDVPMLARRLRSARTSLGGLRSAYATFGAVDGDLGVAEMARRTWSPNTLSPANRSRNRVAGRLTIAEKFAKRAQLDEETIERIERVRLLVERSSRENTRRYDGNVFRVLRDLIAEVAEAIELMGQRSGGTSQILFELVAFP